MWQPVAQFIPSRSERSSLIHQVMRPGRGFSTAGWYGYSLERRVCKFMRPNKGVNGHWFLLAYYARVFSTSFSSSIDPAGDGIFRHLK